MTTNIANLREPPDLCPWRRRVGTAACRRRRPPLADPATARAVNHFTCRPVIDVQSLSTMRIFGTDDPNVAIADWSLSGRVLTNGNPYEMSYATFATFRNGALANYREYWNPMVFLTALGDDKF